MKISLSLIMFMIMSAWVLSAASYVVLTRNIVRAAYALLGALFGVAVLYAMMEADFLAAVQVLVYVGGINILIIFGVMLTEHAGNVPFKMVSLNVVWAALVCIGLFAALSYSLMPYTVMEATQAAGVTTASIGRLFLGGYLLPFEVTSVLLLAVLVGAVAVGRKEVRSK